MMIHLQKRTRKIYTFMALSLLLLLYMLIFGFSAQDGEESGSLSRQVSRIGAEMWNEVTNRNWSEQEISQTAIQWEYPVRKLAHFSEYAVLGGLVTVIVSCWVVRPGRRKLLIALWIAASAGADEFHQAFVPGRYSSLGDVLLDTVGGIFGSVICVWLIMGLMKYSNKKAAV